MSETQFYVWVAFTQTVTIVSVLFGVWLYKKNVAAHFDDVDAWFDRIEARFDSLDARFGDAEVPRT